MSKSKVVEFCPFMATIDVTVEMQLVTMVITLCFGPFNSKELATDWVEEVKRLHLAIEANEDKLALEVLKQTGFDLGPFVRSYFDESDVVQVGPRAHEPGALIRPEEPSRTAPLLLVYALNGFLQAADSALDYIENTPKD